MIPANFDYEAPRTLEKVLALLSSSEDAKVLAGGHSLLPAMKLRLAQPALLIDIGRIAALNYIRESEEKLGAPSSASPGAPSSASPAARDERRVGIAIGATTTHAQLAESELLRRVSPLLSETARHIGDVQVRNRGTIGGSIAHADPAADYPAALLALEAQIRLVSAHSDRTVTALDFFQDAFTTVISPGEIVMEIQVPVEEPSEGHAYEKVAHPASGFAVVGIAAR